MSCFQDPLEVSVYNHILYDLSYQLAYSTAVDEGPIEDYIESWKGKIKFRFPLFYQTQNFEERFNLIMYEVHRKLLKKRSKILERMENANASEQ